MIEPNPPLPSVPDDGDNLDALDINTQPSDLNGPIFFSLNASFNELVEQGAAGEIPNIGSAQQNQVSPADILVAFPDEGPRLYLSAQRLGLHPLFDDVDALALFDPDQDGEFDEQIDQVFFSVRRGSQVVGQLDSALGIPIAPGDILTLPGPPTDFSQPFPPPEVVVLAEDLGLLADRIPRDPFGDVLLTTENRVAAIADPLPDDLDALSLGIQDGDMNCNFRWDSGDVSAFQLALESAGLYESQFGLICSGNAALHGDVSMDGRFDFQDIEDFKRIMSNAGTLSAAQVEAMFAATVPEPANRLAFFFIALLQILTWQRNHRT